MTGLEIGDIGIDECAKEFQEVGKCENVVKTSSMFTVVSGDYGQIPAPGTSLTIVSMDVLLKGEYTSIFPPIYNCSTNNPCLHGGTCHNAFPKGTVICECVRGFTGPHCEWATRTFYGSSYIWLEALTAYERSEVSMEFITKSANGLLMYQGPLFAGKVRIHFTHVATLTGKWETAYNPRLTTDDKSESISINRY